LEGRSGDGGELPKTGLAMMHAAMSRIMLRRIARPASDFADSQ
jgi:hypothetical protein